MASECYNIGCKYHPLDEPFCHLPTCMEESNMSMLDLRDMEEEDTR